MASLRKRLEIVAAQSAELLAHRHELEQLREQVRIAERLNSQDQAVASPRPNRTLLADVDPRYS
jgi:hypothetical protein